MRIGIVLHGPEIVDAGSAQRIIGIFKREHDIIVKLGGTMGRTAVLDAGLEVLIWQYYSTRGKHPKQESSSGASWHRNLMLPCRLFILKVRSLVEK